MSDWVLVALNAELDTGIAMDNNKWQTIDALSQTNWLNDGNVYEETEVIFCDEYGAYCGNVKSGDMPTVWVTFEPTDRNPTHWMLLPQPPMIGV
jgi:hypothetical protein